MNDDQRDRFDSNTGPVALTNDTGVTEGTEGLEHAHAGESEHVYGVHIDSDVTVSGPVSAETPFDDLTGDAGSWSRND